MDKETKELLKRTLTMTDDKLLLKFAKSYAAKDKAFAEAIIEKLEKVKKCAIICLFAHIFVTLYPIRT